MGVYWICTEAHRLTEASLKKACYPDHTSKLFGLCVQASRLVVCEGEVSLVV